MFTGIIEEVGTIEALERGADPSGGARIVIRAAHSAGGDSPHTAPLQEGESIAVNGVCLTAKTIAAETFSADLAPETLARSSLGALRVGSRVNLERAMMPSSRFSGHVVQGHVDGTGTLVSLDTLPDGNYWLTVQVPAELERYIVWKGSIALNGTSLTVAKLEGNRVGVAIIPHTFENTVLRDMRPGDPINIECDVIAKHVEKLLSCIELPVQSAAKRAAESSLTIDRLIEEGF
jgi:riboflavin synthase